MRQFTRLEQYQWCYAARDVLCLLDALATYIDDKVFSKAQARARLLKVSLANKELEGCCKKLCNKLMRRTKKQLEALVPDKGGELLTRDDLKPAVLTAMFLAELLVMDAVNTCPAFSSTPAWVETKKWLRESARDFEQDEPTPEEVLAGEMYHQYNCELLGYPKKYGW